MQSINLKYSSDVNKIANIKQYSSTELKTKRNAGLTTDELKQLKTQKKFCKTNKFKRVKGNRNNLIKQHLRLAISIARDIYIRSGIRTIELDDVVQAANLGLVIAADKYLASTTDSKYATYAFSTYAYNWIKKYVLDEINLTSHQLTRIGTDAYKRLGNDLKMISKDDDITYADYDNNPINNELSSSTTSQTILEHEHALDSQRKLLQKIFEPLSSNEKMILCALFGLHPFSAPQTGAEIAKRNGLHRSAISNIKKHAFNKIYWGASAKEREAMQTFSIIAGLDTRDILCDI
jgi:RNA polymerase sigma factor (sigma-70 family)